MCMHQKFRHDDGAEKGLSSGTSGPNASRDDGAIFLTATKTNKGSVRRGFLLTLGGFLLRTQDVILFQHWVRRDEQRERECAENASLIPIRRGTNTIRPRERGHTRADACTSPRPRTPPDARRRPRPFYVGILERVTFQLFQFCTTF